MIVNPVGLDEYLPEGELKGDYTLKIEEYVDYPQNGSVMVKYIIIDGPEPEGFRSPLGRKVNDFINVDESRCQEPWQIESLIRKLGDFGTCFGVDPTQGLDLDSMIGMEGRVGLFPAKKSKKDDTIVTKLKYLTN